jgi:D-ornithine 4,5-aminomutase subunit beta
MGLDGLLELVTLRNDGPLRAQVRELKEYAVLFLEEILQRKHLTAALTRVLLRSPGETR